MARCNRVLGILAACLLLMGCGKKSDDASKALQGLFSKAQTSNIQLHEVVHPVAPKIRELREKLLSQAWLAKFQVEAGQTPAPIHATVTDDPNLNCSGSNPDGTGGTFNLSCTATADAPFTCGSESYVMKSGSTMSVSGTFASNIFSMTMNVNSTISGGGFGSGTGLVCGFSVALDFTKLTLQTSEPFTADCSSVSFSCTMGSDTISCSDMLSSFNDSGNYCSQS